MIKIINKKNIFHFICIAFILFSVYVLIFKYQLSFYRLIESVKSFGLSFAYYVCEIFEIPNSIDTGVNNIPNYYTINFPNVSDIIPETKELFLKKSDFYFKLIFNSDNLKLYNIHISNYLNIFLKTALSLVPIIAMFIIIFKLLLNRPNNNYNLDTKPLRIFKAVSAKTYRPFKQTIKDFYSFLDYRRLYIFFICLIWLYNMNLIAVAFSALAWAFYFVVSINFASIYFQLYRLILDLGVLIKTVPLIVWLIIAFIVFLSIRKKIAFKRLRHFEMRNRGFINSMEIVSMNVGTMGKKKTTLLTDMALSQEPIFRHKALEILIKYDMKFPFFPWINLENKIKQTMKNHKIYNLATCVKFVKWIEEEFTKEPCKEKCFDYDFEKYGLFFNDNLKIQSLFGAILNYTKAYFIYVIESSLIIANYSIRTDAILNDLGNFPLWNDDFFKRDTKMQESYSRYSKILDFDMLRIGKKIIENNKKSNALDFGIICITEIGKERGNSVELQGVKKQADETNQRNDLFNAWLKLARHLATVDNFPFIKVFTDEQRAESLGADARELANIIHIEQANEKRLALPFFAIEELIYNLIQPHFENVYINYRFLRGDNCLFLYLYKKIASKLYNYYEKIYNQYAYIKAELLTEQGTQDGVFESHKYYLMSKKIYSKRFSTDCYSDYFMQRSLMSNIGIIDLEEYESIKADNDELASQNSYFINELLSRLNQPSERQ